MHPVPRPKASTCRNSNSSHILSTQLHTAANNWELESVALPPLGIGVGLVEPEVSARVLVEILVSHLDEGGPPHDLTIVVSSSYESELFTQLVEEMLEGS